MNHQHYDFCETAIISEKSHTGNKKGISSILRSQQSNNQVSKTTTGWIEQAKNFFRTSSNLMTSQQIPNSKPNSNQCLSQTSNTNISTSARKKQNKISNLKYYPETLASQERMKQNLSLQQNRTIGPFPHESNLL